MILTSQGEDRLIKYWRYFEIPTKWSRLPNLISHRHLFMMSDILCVLIILPFILIHYLTINDIKTTFFE